jgi:FG-GAP-like repeat/FG-GAP repeat
MLIRIMTGFRYLAWIAAVLVAVRLPAQTPAPLKPGFPVTLTGSGPVTFSKPAVADLDQNGVKEIIVGTSGGRLYVINNNGAIRAGWPQTLPCEIDSSPAAGVLANDGGLDIVVGCGTAANTSVSGGVYAFRRDGTFLWQVVTQPYPSTNVAAAVFSTPAIGDLNGDGINDVVFGAFDMNVYAVRGTDGTALPGWPIFVRDSVWTSPAIADLNGDGRKEVVIGADCHLEGPPYDTPDGGALWVFRADGSEFPGFPQFIASGQPIVGITSSPAVGDIDGDGCPEIVVGTGGSSSSASRLLMAWHRDGSPVAGWPVALLGHAANSPILVDLNGDGVLDVVDADDTATVYGIAGWGAALFQIHPKTSTGASAVVVNEASAAQVGANNPVILETGVGFEVTLISKTGVQLSDDGTHGAGMLTYGTGHPVIGAVAADLDGTATLDIIAASGPSAVNTTDGAVYAWTAGAMGAMPWPMFHHDAARNGSQTTGQVCPPPPRPLHYHAIVPCRIVDTRQPGNLTYGGPAFAAGEQRVVTFTGVCGIPAEALAVAVNVTAIGAGSRGDLRLFPGRESVPKTSTINFNASQTRANNAIVPLSSNGQGHLEIQADLANPAATVNVVVDVNGYFAAR